MKITNTYRILLVLSVLTFVFAGFACSRGHAAQTDTQSGKTFKMVMTAPGKDTMEFNGKVLNGDMRLTGLVGGIETHILLINGKLYTINPAIKTATEIENPKPPALNKDGWIEWLMEFGRISPISFGGLIGIDSDTNGNVNAGDKESVTFSFSEGTLSSVSFTVPGGSGLVTYTYSNFRDDTGVKSSDFEIPSDYLVS